MKKTAQTWGLLALAVVLLGVIAWYSMQTPAPEQTPEPGETLVESTFTGKVVYASSADEADAAADCEERGGTFNTCGSPCAPDAEVCIQLCVLTCELPTDN